MGLERLNILFFFMNLTGMLPNRMVVDRRTKRFKRFENGWQHPITWWFIFILVAQLIWIPYFCSFQIEVLSHFQESFVYLMVIVLWQVSYTLVKFSPFLLVFRIGKLKEALVTLAKVDQELQKIRALENKPCTSRMRTIIGIMFIIFVIFLIHFSASPFLSILYETYGFSVLICMTIVECISKFQLGIWFLLFHLTYYNIAHRVSLLTSLITTPVPAHQFSLKITVVPLKSSNQQDQHLHKIGNLFDRLAKATSHLESVFSFPSLLVLTTSFLSCTIGLFIFIRELFTPTSFQATIYLQVVSVVSNIAAALVVILSADFPSQEARRLRECVMRISTETQNLNDSTECTALLMSLSDDRFQLSAGGLFIVKKQLIPSLTGTVITYLVILLQNAISKNNTTKPIANSYTNESSAVTEFSTAKTEF